MAGHPATAIKPSSEMIKPSSESLSGRPDEGSADEAPDSGVLVEDLLVEEVSIDGMCGVY